MSAAWAAASLVLAICCAPLTHSPDRGIRAAFLVWRTNVSKPPHGGAVISGGYRRLPCSSTPAFPRAVRAAFVLVTATPAVRSSSTLVVRPAGAAAPAVARTQ